MYRGIRIALTAGVFLLAFAALPPMLPASTTLNLSGSAQAQKAPTTDATNLNSSRSNVDRMGGGGGAKGGTTTPEKQDETNQPATGGITRSVTAGTSGEADKAKTIPGAKPSTAQ